MKIWVDADACPVPVKEILFRAAERTGVELILVANQPMRKPNSVNIKIIQVLNGYDEADNEISRRVKVGDLVITADIPLAATVLARRAMALDPRGERYSASTINARLGMRDLLDVLRGSGIQSGGQAPYSQSDRKAFANQLDKILTRYLSGKNTTNE